MKFFTGFKNIFNKTVSLAPHQHNDVVSFVKFRNGMIKMGSELIVEPNYSLIFVYYNKVCDILNAGQYTFNEEVAPKLFRYSKAVLSKKGLFTPKSIKADAYFLSLNEFNHNSFKTQERIVTYKDDEKIKIKLEGNFSFKIVDVERCMKALCSDYAIIRNKKIVKELCSTVGFEVSKTLNKNNFTLDDYFINKEKICKTIAEGVNAHTQNFGVEVSKFFINQIILPKKYDLVSSNSKTHGVYNENEVNSDIVKIVEERLNDLQKDLDIVYVNEKGDNIVSQDNIIKENVKTEENNQSTIINNSNSFENINNLNNAMSSTVHPSNFEKQNNIPVVDNNSYIPSNQPEPNIFTNTNNNVGQNEENVSGLVINDEFVDNLIDKISKRKKQKRNSRIVQILTEAGFTGTQTITKNVSDKKCKYCGSELTEDAKFCAKCGKSVEELLSCPCCGAKNFNTAEVCCVCKSKLN